MNENKIENDNPRLAMQSIFNSTVCYDIMQESNKIIVFETYISFQLAFFALVEHDTEIAALWDPEKRCIVGMMTTYDYIRALMICRHHNTSPAELATKSIHEIMAMSVMTFRHSETQSIDAEDTIFQLYIILRRSLTDYVSVINPDEGNIVAILGYPDILNLLHIASRQHPQLFGATLQQIMTAPDGSQLPSTQTVTVTGSTKLCDVLNLIDQRDLTVVPIVDDITRRVIGVYHKSDVTFIVKAADPDAIVANMTQMSMTDVLIAQQQLLSQFQAGASGGGDGGNSSSGAGGSSASSGSISPRQQNILKFSALEKLSTVVDAMVAARVTHVVCVNEADLCLGLISVADILRYFVD